MGYDAASAFYMRLNEPKEPKEPEEPREPEEPKGSKEPREPEESDDKSVVIDLESDGGLK